MEVHAFAPCPNCHPGYLDPVWRDCAQVPRIETDPDPDDHGLAKFVVRAAPQGARLVCSRCGGEFSPPGFRPAATLLLVAAREGRLQLIAVGALPRIKRLEHWLVSVRADQAIAFREDLPQPSGERPSHADVLAQLFGAQTVTEIVEKFTPRREGQP
jgi:hypothetical protein